MPRNIYLEEHEDFRASVREFVDRNLAPRAEEFIRDHTIPRDVWLEAGKQGFLGLDIPEEYGGAGAGDYRFNAILAEVARHGVRHVCVTASTRSSPRSGPTSRRPRRPASASTPTSARPISSTSAPRSRSSAGCLASPPAS